MSVCVAHPQVQHSHQVVLALSKTGLLHSYYTSFFFDQRKFEFLPRSIQGKLRKRYHPDIPLSRVITFPYFDVLFKLLGKMAGPCFREKAFYYNVWNFDRFMARPIALSDARIVVGYENSCRDIFRQAKKVGKVCVLDAASVHYQAQKEVYRPTYAESFLDRVNTRKEAEIQAADYILTLSSYAKETYVRAGVPESKISVIPLGVDMLKFSSQGIEPRPGGVFNFLFVGNLKLSKGVDLLLDAFDRLDVPGKHLTIIGARGDAEMLLRECRPNVTVKAHMPHDSLWHEYAATDVFVLPSRLDGFGMVVVEAMAASKPVIVSTHVGAKDLVEEDLNGWVFESGDSVALSRVMKNAYDMSPRLQTMGNRGRELISQHTWEVYRENIQQFYTDRLAQRP